MLLNKIREVNTRAVVIVIAYTVEEALQLYEMGASYVLLPHLIGANNVMNMITKYRTDAQHFKTIQTRHVTQLRRRRIDA